MDVMPYTAVDTSVLSKTVETSLEIPTVAFDLSSKYREDVVTQLNLSNNQYLTDISFVLGFPDLLELNFVCCSNLKNNYKQAAPLRKLQKLNLSATYFTELAPISEFKSLTYLNISSYPGTKIVKHLIPLKELKTLFLRVTQNVTDLERLPELKSLQNLSLRSVICFNFDSDEEPHYKSIDFLSEVKGLVELDLGYNDCLHYIKPLTALPQLTQLDLTGSENIKDWENIKNIKQLEILDVRHIKLSQDTLKELKHLKTLIKDY